MLEHKETEVMGDEPALMPITIAARLRSAIILVANYTVFTSESLSFVLINYLAVMMDLLLPESPGVTMGPWSGGAPLEPRGGRKLVAD